jgi:HTH-type transcriptional regulator, glycine betaine synthesis regulator
MARRAVELKVADQIGLIMEFWGFKRVHGRVWTTLFLAQGPLSAAEIRERLGVSVGATSMALGELRRWGAVHEARRPGARCTHYEPETNIWRLVARVLQDREKRLLEETLEVFASAIRELNAEGATGAARRVEKLAWLTRLARGMLDMLTSRGELAAEDTMKMKV